MPWDPEGSIDQEMLPSLQQERGRLRPGESEVFFLVVPMENTKVVSMAMGIAKIDGLFHGKFPSRNG